MQCHARQYSALLRELKALKRRYRSTDASSFSSEEPHDFSRLKLDKLLGETLMFARLSHLPICSPINTWNTTSVSWVSHFCTCPPCNINQSSIKQSIKQAINQSINFINQSLNQYAHAHLAICTCPPCNMHMPGLQYAYAHLAIFTRPPCNMHMPTLQCAYIKHAICTIPPCNVHLPTLQHASAHLVMCTRSPCSMQAPAGRVSSLCRSHFCLHDHAVTDQHTQPTLLMLAKTQRKLCNSYI